MSQHRKFPYTLNPDEIPTRKIIRVAAEEGQRVDYACPDACWREHFDAWCREWRKGNKTAPQPQPWGHCMFSDPASYASVPYGCTDPEMFRAAWESEVRGNLNGWDGDLKKTAAGRERLEAIVKATVDARMGNQTVGVAPYLACILSDV